MSSRFRDGHTGLPESAKVPPDELPGDEHVSFGSENPIHFDPYPESRVFPPDPTEVEPGVRVVSEREHADSERRQQELLRMDIARSYRKIDDPAERERLRLAERIPPDPLGEMRDHLDRHRRGMADQIPETFEDTILPSAEGEEDPEEPHKKHKPNREKRERRIIRRELDAGKKRRGYEYDEEGIPIPKASKKEKISMGIRSWFGSFRRPRDADRKTGDRPLRRAKRRGLVE